MARRRSIRGLPQKYTLTTPSGATRKPLIETALFIARPLFQFIAVPRLRLDTPKCSAGALRRGESFSEIASGNVLCRSAGSPT
jgi:hypothetical protein